MIINNTVGRGGSSGKDGITPHIGSNGNWFLGTEDTGVLAKAQGNTKIVEVALLATNWNDDLEQTIACDGVSANEAKQMVTLLPALDSKAAYSSCRVTCTAFAENSLTFTAETLPEEDILVYVAMEDERTSTLNNVYSTEETVIGTWIDGKPIYRKGYALSVTSNRDNIIDYIANTDITFLNGYGYLKATVWKATYPIPYSSYATSQFWSWCARHESGKILLQSCWDAEHTFVGILFIEYTKTTDTATIDIPTTAALLSAYDEGVQES